MDPASCTCAKPHCSWSTFSQLSPFRRRSSRATELSRTLYTVATVERHDETITPFERQLGWKPGANDDCLVPADRVFIKHGYLPPPAAIEHLRALHIERVYVCGIQTETCCLAAGFMLFDAGLHPTLLTWLSVGSSLDRSGRLGASLWQHHFGAVIHDADAWAAHLAATA